MLNKTTMCALCLAGHLFLAGGVTPALGQRCRNLRMQVDPPNPLESTPVTVTLAAECNDTCLSVCDAPSANAGAFAFHIDWYIRDVIAQTGCLTVIVTLSSDVVLGLLDAGDYVVTTAAHITGHDTPCTQATFLDETVATFRVLPDCNGNGIADGDDVAGGTSDDCNGNGIPDACEPDCNGNGVADGCDIAESTAADCNGNGVPDACDLVDRTSRDINGNGVPDECDAGLPAVSTWGLIIMGLLLLAGAKTHFGRRSAKPRPSRASSLLLLCTVTLLSTGSAYAQKPTLESPHDPERLLVRFKPGTSDETKDLVNTAIGATELKRYRYVDRLLLVRVLEEQLPISLGPVCFR